MKKDIKDQFARLIDLKSMITFVIIANLIFVVDYIMITGAVIDDKVFLLFSNVVTMIATYFFTKKKSDEGVQANDR